VAADGAGLDHRRHDRGGRRRFRRDLFDRGEHAHPQPVPRRTDVLSGGIHGGRARRARRVRLRVLLLVCLPERVLRGERSSVIVPGHISAGERVCVRIRAHIPVAVRVPERPVLVRLPLPVPDLGLAYIRVPHADADHIGADLVEHTHIVGTRNFGTRIHSGDHSRAGEHSTVDIRFYVAAPGEKG
jgi:hypothetical protein